jgi:hypothetical protein
VQKDSCTRDDVEGQESLIIKCFLKNALILCAHGSVRTTGPIVVIHDKYISLSGSETLGLKIRFRLSLPL